MKYVSKILNETNKINQGLMVFLPFGAGIQRWCYMGLYTNWTEAGRAKEKDWNYFFHVCSGNLWGRV